MRFRIAALELAPDATEAELTGRLLDGTPIAGSDSLRVVGGGDGNMDGLVDGAGCTVWADSYAARVPEPAALFLSIGAAVPLLLKRRRSRRGSPEVASGLTLGTMALIRRRG